MIEFDSTSPAFFIVGHLIQHIISVRYLFTGINYNSNNQLLKETAESISLYNFFISP